MEEGMDDWGKKGETLAMKAILVLWGVAAFATGQVVVPENGWRLVEKGEGKIEGMQKLGVWDNVVDRNQNGDVMVGAVFVRYYPFFLEKGGLGHKVQW